MDKWSGRIVRPIPMIPKIVGYALVCRPNSLNERNMCQCQPNANVPGRWVPFNGGIVQQNNLENSPTTSTVSNANSTPTNDSGIANGLNRSNLGRLIYTPNNGSNTQRTRSPSAFSPYVKYPETNALPSGSEISGNSNAYAHNFYANANSSRTNPSTEMYTNTSGQEYNTYDVPNYSIPNRESAVNYMPTSITSTVNCDRPLICNCQVSSVGYDPQENSMPRTNHGFTNVNHMPTSITSTVNCDRPLICNCQVSSVGYDPQENSMPRTNHGFTNVNHMPTSITSTVNCDRPLICNCQVSSVGYEPQENSMPRTNHGFTNVNHMPTSITSTVNCDRPLICNCQVSSVGYDPQENSMPRTNHGFTNVNHMPTSITSTVNCDRPLICNCQVSSVGYDPQENSMPRTNHGFTNVMFQCGASNCTNTEIFKCPSCFNIGYCSLMCQAYHWRSHKNSCYRGNEQHHYHY